MAPIHCDICGGFISDERPIAYRLPLDVPPVAEPRSALCACEMPVVYGAPPGHMSSPGMPAVRRTSSGEVRS